ncbi:cobaltochelatase subunit CobN [Methanothermobacter sp. K4]|uniref:cobaltochelatase subunit CobN n=1 Tax=Methanothermobacter sp. K4 TaxID=2913262 RepID=UPI001EDBBC3E|nr:cobaltochelatase subunit CobN [Methanothermobacter sp. K4]MCG2829145.1 cobaltochelatase subunit CobN [Methanothermobacter sp. K4]
MKKFLLIAMILLLVSVPSVSAADNDTNTTDSKMLKDTNMVVLLTGCVVGTVDPIMNDAYRNDLLPSGYNFTLKIYTMDTFNLNSTASRQFKNDLKNADIFFLFTRPGYPVTGMSYGTEFDAAVDFQALAASMKPGARIFVLGPVKPNVTGVNVTNLPAYGPVAAPALSRENIKRTLLEVLRLSGAVNLTANDTKLVPGIQDFLYHPLAPRVYTDRASYTEWYMNTTLYRPGAPWVGVAILNRYYLSGNMDVYETLIQKLEAKGLNVIPYFYCSDPIGASRRFFMVNNSSVIDALVACVQFGYWPDNQTITFFTDLNVPVQGPLPVFLQTSLDDYINSSRQQGLRGLEYYWLAMFEMQGRIEPILIGGNRVSNPDPITGVTLKEYVAYEPGINQLVERTLSWVKLRKTVNSEKRVAVIYFDSTHDEGMPATNGLNLYASLSNILLAMRAAGYTTGNGNLTPEYIYELINRAGRNPRNMKQSELRKLVEAGCITLPVSEYLQWYSKLPATLRRQVEAIWGPAPGNIMVYNRSIVIPGFILGNMFIGPQPVWKWNGTLNNGTLPPTHQFIAFYLWLQNGFRADAVVHIGQHGTLELLPGHVNAMTENDWPNTLIGSIPNIHLLKMEDPLEAVINPAKRRAYAVTISYLIPPVMRTELYGVYQELADLLGSYSTAEASGDLERMNVLKSLIRDGVKRAGLDVRLNVSNSTDFSVIRVRLEEYLHELTEILMPYGLHTFGELPDSETLERFLDAIISFDPANRTARRDEIRNLLIMSASNEMASLLRALNGEFIQPAPARSPIINLAALPTGRNMYTFDPSSIPDPAAVVMGSRAAEEMLKRHRDANGGRYPQTVAVDIGDVISTGGQSIAAIFYLLGVKPIYESGALIGTEIIPLSELGRPRIDVVISDFHNFRGAIPGVMDVIDNTIKRIANLNESAEMNYVRKHYITLRSGIYSELVASGMNSSEADALADRLARTRIFGLPPGADPHGAGVDRILWSRDDWTAEQLAETYLSYYSYAYGRDLNGLQSPKLLESLLRTVDTTMVIMPYRAPGEGTCLYRVSVTVNFMVNYLTGRNINSYIAKTAYGTPIIRTLQESAYDDLAVTLLNPTWIQGKLREGPSGSASIALQVRDLFTSDALVDVASDDVWRRIADTFLFDGSVRSQLDASALQMIARYVRQAHTRGLVALSGAELAAISEMLGEGTSTDTDQGGEQGSDHETTTGSPGNTGRDGRGSAGTHAGVSAQSQTSESGASSPEAAGVTEQKPGSAYEISTPHAEDKSGSAQLYAVIGILGIFCLLGVGYYFGPLRK